MNGIRSQGNRGGRYLEIISRDDNGRYKTYYVSYNVRVRILFLCLILIMKKSADKVLLSIMKQGIVTRHICVVVHPFWLTLQGNGNMFS